MNIEDDIMKNVFLVINYNDEVTTSLLVESIKNFSCIDLIVILDNKSKDDSFSMLRKKYKNERIHVIQSEENKGYAYAINFGSRYIMNLIGDCNIIVSNSDIEIYCENDLKTLLDSKNEDEAMIAPVIKEHEGLSKGWKIPTPIQDCLLNIVYIHRWLRPKLLFYPESYFKGKDKAEVEVVLGCFFVIDSRYLKKANYYDEATFLYYEENIMAKKLKDIGAKTVINLNVEVFHNHSVSIDKSINRLNKYKILKESQYYFQTKYHHANWLERCLLKFTYKMSYYILKLVYQIKG